MTRGGNAKGASVGKHEDRSVARDFYASVSHPQDAATAAEAADAAESVEKQRYADVMVARGVNRRTAVQCAEGIFEVQRARDAEFAGRFMVGSVDEVSGAAMGWMLEPDAADKLFEAMSRVFAARDATLAMGCLCFAMGKPPYGYFSERKLAAARGVSPEAVSNEVIEFQTILGLPRTAQQKSDRAVQAYAACNGAGVGVKKL